MGYPKLIRALNEFMGLCVKYKCIYPDYVEIFLAKLESGEPISKEEVSNVSHYLFGGMGSLNDLVISKFNRHEVSDEKAANRELDSIRAQIKNAWKEIEK